MRGRKKEALPGEICFETVGRIPDGGGGKNEHVLKSLRNSCGAVLARYQMGGRKKRHPPGKVVFETLGRIPDGGSGKNEHA